jgi:type III pantothenate kinase
MLLLLDIGNTHTHLALATRRRVQRQGVCATRGWADGSTGVAIRQFCGRQAIEGIAFCSVVPRATPACIRFAKSLGVPALELNSKTIAGVGIDYPQPETIGPDRLANAVAVRAFYGAPALVVDFGTAVTFDVVDRSGNYVGGIIAPGLSAMTDYLHEKTALLPRIEIREPRRVIGRNTEEAMLVGAVHGYRGLVRGLIQELKKDLRTRRLPVVATGGYAGLIARKMPEITAVRPSLTLEGLRLVWIAHYAGSTSGKEKRSTGAARGTVK